MAVFDLDRTLICGSSLVHLARELVRRGIVRPAAVARHSLWNAVFERRGLSEMRVERLCAAFLAAVRGMPAQPLADAARYVGGRITEDIKPGARWLVDRHLAAGDFCVVVSASPHELVEGVAAALGIHRAIGTRVEVVDGLCTGRLDGSLCYGPKKVERLLDDIGRFDLTGATGYADSESDLPLLRLCKTAIAVNPDPGLRRAAQARRWPVVSIG